MQISGHFLETSAVALYLSTRVLSSSTKQRAAAKRFRALARDTHQNSMERARGTLPGRRARNARMRRAIQTHLPLASITRHSCGCSQRAQQCAKSRSRHWKLSLRRCCRNTALSEYHKHGWQKSGAAAPRSDAAGLLRTTSLWCWHRALCKNTNFLGQPWLRLTMTLMVAATGSAATSALPRLRQTPFLSPEELIFYAKYLKYLLRKMGLIDADLPFFQHETGTNR